MNKEDYAKLTDEERSIVDESKTPWEDVDDNGNVWEN